MEDIKLTDEQKETLESLLFQYKAILDEFAAIDARKKAMNMMIKATLEEYGITRFMDKDGYTVSMSKTPNIKWDMEGLAEYCKTLNVQGLVVEQPVVDMEILETLLVNNRISAYDIKQFQTVNPDTVRLNTSQKKIIAE